VVITPVKIADAGTRAAADAMYAEFKAKGIDVLYDDRDMSPGAKFKDADLIGVPYRVTLGRKLSEGIVEVVERRGNVKLEVAVGEAVAWVAERVAAAKAK
jgi:prolyl-tRNA synthetase